MAEALNSPRRSAEFERMNHADQIDSANRDLSLTPAECLQAATELNRFAFELAAAAEASRVSHASRT